MCGECNWPIEIKHTPLSAGGDPPAHLPERKAINVNGQEEHEAVLKNSAKCRELGVDQIYETILYLNRWGGWLDNER